MLKATDTCTMSLLSQKVDSLPEVHTCRKCCQESCESHCNSSSECLWLLWTTQMDHLPWCLTFGFQSSMLASSSSSGGWRTKSYTSFLEKGLSAFRPRSCLSGGQRKFFLKEENNLGSQLCVPMCLQPRVVGTTRNQLGLQELLGWHHAG